MTIKRSYRIVDYIDDNTFYVQFRDVDAAAYSPAAEDGWEELTLCEPDTPAIEVVREVLVECEALGQRVTEAQEMVALKQEAIAALLKAQDEAQAEIKRLQGLLDAKHKPGFGLSKEQTDNLRMLVRNYGRASYDATDVEAKWKDIDDALHNYTKE